MVRMAGGDSVRGQESVTFDASLVAIEEDQSQKMY